MLKWIQYKLVMNLSSQTKNPNSEYSNTSFEIASSVNLIYPSRFTGFELTWYVGLDNLLEEEFEKSYQARQVVVIFFKRVVAEARVESLLQTVWSRICYDADSAS